MQYSTLLRQLQATSLRQRLGWMLLLFSALLTGAAFNAFWRLKPDEIPTSSPWNIFVMGVVSFVSGIFLLTSTAPAAERTPTWMLQVLGIIMVLALLMRVYRFDEHPVGMFYDEIYAGLDARHVLHEADFRPVFQEGQNLTLPHYSLFAICLAIFGETSPQALRMLSLFWGLGAVWLAFWVGKEARNPIFGLLMAFFLAVMHWAIHYSHLAITAIDAPFWILLALYWLLRLRQSHHARHALWLGVAVGCGMWFYVVFRLVAVSFVLMAAILFWREWKAPRHALLMMSLIVITVLVFTFPFTIYIHTNPDRVLGRARELNIFDAANRSTPTVEQAYFENLVRHLKMFNFKGDHNAMLNIPDKPMLDPLMGVLFLIGLALALVEVSSRRRWENLWFLIPLPLGILTSSFTLERETPHAGRTIGGQVSIIFSMALAVWIIGHWLYQRGMPAKILTVIVCIGSLWLSYDNFQLYYFYHARLYDWWLKSGGLLDQLNDQAALRLSANYRIVFSSEQPVLQLALTHPELDLDATRYQLETLYPLTDERDTAIFFEKSNDWFFSYSQALYPNAPISPFYSSAPDLINAPPTLLPYYFVVDVRRGDIARIQGLAGDGSGYIYVTEYGDYVLRSSDGSPLWVNNRAVTAEESITLVEGFNPILSSAPLEWKHGDQADFEAMPPDQLYHGFPLLGLEGIYYQNSPQVGADKPGEPIFARIDPNMNGYVHYLPHGIARPYSVHWQGWLDAPLTGEYNFWLEVNGYAELQIDGQPILAITDPDVQGVETARLALTAGEHELDFLFYDFRDYSFIWLQWAPPGGARSAIPSSALHPPDPLVEID